jgi:hypothetical protein
MWIQPGISKELQRSHVLKNRSVRPVASSQKGEGQVVQRLADYGTKKIYVSAAGFRLKGCNQCCFSA